MKKNFLLTSIFLIITLIVYVAATFAFCYTTNPEISTGEFPFCILYEYKGETGTLSGVMKCEYSSSSTIHGVHNRYWKQDTVYENPNNLEHPFVIEQNDELQTTLSVHENMDAGYFMGDPLHADFYQVYGYEGPRPQVSFYDYKNENFLEDATEEELADLDFKIVDFNYGDPISNNFSFSGVRYKADNIIIFVAIMLLFLMACLIFVRKDEKLQYSKIDRIGIVCNFIIAFTVVPFITFFCMLFGIVESYTEWLNQLTYTTPSLTILFLALSIVLRRQGYPKTSFFIQFGGVILFLAILVLDSIGVRL